jgi:hypothetical protein
MATRSILSLLVMPNGEVSEVTLTVDTQRTGTTINEMNEKINEVMGRRMDIFWEFRQLDTILYFVDEDGLQKQMPFNPVATGIMFSRGGREALGLHGPVFFTGPLKGSWPTSVPDDLRANFMEM